MNHIKSSALDLDAAAKSWLEVCNRLCVNIVAPYILEVNGESISYLAYLPDFGGPSGILICPMNLPEVRPDERLRQMARSKGFYVSSMNVSPYANGNVEEEVFKKILEDWGYYGLREKRPVWYGGSDHSK